MTLKTTRRGFLVGALALGVAGAIDPMTVFASEDRTHLLGLWQRVGPGGTVRDGSKFHNNGFTVGGVTAAAPEGFHLSGGGYIRVPKSAVLEPKVFALSASVRALQPGNFRYIVAKGAQACRAASYGLHSGQYGGLVFYISNGSDFILSADAGPKLWDGAWHTVRGTYDGTSVGLFVDGRRIGQPVASPISIRYGLLDSNDLLIGNYDFPCTQPFEGDIADVALWDSPLAGSGRVDEQGG